MVTAIFSRVEMMAIRMTHPDPMAIALSGRVLSSEQRCHLLNLVGLLRREALATLL